MIGRRDVIKAGALILSLSAAEAASATSFVAMQKHDPSSARRKIQEILKFILRGEYDKFIEDAQINKIYDFQGEVAGEERFVEFSKWMRESQGRVDGKPLQLGAMKKICADEYAASYLCELKRNQYFQGYEDPEGLMTVEEGFHDMSETWLFTFSENSVDTARSLDELRNLRWYAHA